MNSFKTAMTALEKNRIDAKAHAAIRKCDAVDAMLEALEVAMHSGELSFGNHAYASVADAIKQARGI